MQVVLTVLQAAAKLGFYLLRTTRCSYDDRHTARFAAGSSPSAFASENYFGSSDFSDPLVMIVYAHLSIWMLDIWPRYWHAPNSFLSSAALSL
jgi:hypothetical protein